MDKKHIHFALTCKPDEQQIQDVEELKKILWKVGVNIVLSMSDDYNGLSLFWDPEEVKEKFGRGAGRSKKFAKGMLRYSEVQAMLEKDSAENVAAELEMSRATLYRKLREFKNDQWRIDTDDYFV